MIVLNCMPVLDLHVKIPDDNIDTNKDRLSEGQANVSIIGAKAFV